jgi:diguanylate cyclase
MADIDHFKRVNDSYGHLIGDKVLHAVGRALQANVKGKDTASRFGGEEFAVLLPQTPLEGAARLAETLRATIASGRVKSVGSGETVGNITISIGVACYRAGEPAAEFIARADRALYAAKTRGRNRVCLAESDLLNQLA